MLHLDARETREALNTVDAIEAMEEAFTAESEIPLRSLLAGSLFMPGRVGDVTAVKVVSVVPGNPAGLVAVFGSDGTPLGVVDGPTITSIRTGAVCGLATRLLAADGAETLAMLGAGAMAADLVAAVRAVREIKRVVVWSRTTDTAEKLVSRVGGEVERSADTAVASADVVCCATPARQPLFRPEAISPGTHINAVGAFTPKMVEIPAEVVNRAFVVVDDVAAAAAEAGDLIQAGRAPDTTLRWLLSGETPGHEADITLFKSVGVAAQDVTAAHRALQNATERGLGTRL